MALREGLPGTIYRKDYEAPDFGVNTVDLLVQIEHGRTRVTATLDLIRRTAGDRPLRLDGEALDLQWVEVDGARLDSTQYQIGSGQLVIQSVPDGCTLRTLSLIHI